MLRFAIVTPVTGFAMLIACSSGNAPNKLIDGSTNGSDGSAANHDGSSASCALPASFTQTFTGSSCTDTAGTECAFSEGSDGSDYSQSIEWQATLGGSGSGLQYAAMEIFGGGGATNTPDWPTALGAKSGVSLTVNTPDAYIFIGTDVDGSGDPSVIYLATAGTLNITAATATVGSNFAGSFTDVTLTHYDLNGSGQPTNPDADGCTTTIATGTFSTTITTAPTDKPFEPATSRFHASQAVQ
jgi:hypothetical protein